jgi:putative sigma-54 modulation protein
MEARIALKGKHGGVPDTVTEYAERKLSKLERLFHRPPTVELLGTYERGQYVVELNVDGDGVFLRSEERCPELHAAIDNVTAKLDRQVKRFKDRVRHDHRKPIRDVTEPATAPAPGDEEPFQPKIARRKHYVMKPMLPEEAALQLEMIDHPFFVFRNLETGDVSVIYRRRDGSYGLIEPGA